MGDLRSKKLIVAKGIAFLIIAIFSFGLVLVQSPTWQTAALLIVLVWASSRFYYFLFYVLEKYVDPTLRYAGIGALLQAIWNRPKA